MNTDPEGEGYPWSDVAEEAEPREITVADSKIITYACEQTALAALKENRAGDLSGKHLDQLYRFLNELEEKTKLLPMSADLLEASKPQLHSKLGDLSKVMSTPFLNFGLLKLGGMDKYAGNVSQQPTPQ